MIFSDISDERLEEIRHRLLLEGVANREAKIVEICVKTLNVLEEDQRLIWEARQRAMTANEDEFAGKLWDRHNLLGDITKELEAEISGIS